MPGQDCTQSWFHTHSSQTTSRHQKHFQVWKSTNVIPNGTHFDLHSDCSKALLHNFLSSLVCLLPLAPPGCALALLCSNVQRKGLCNRGSSRHRLTTSHPLLCNPFCVQSIGGSVQCPEPQLASKTIDLEGVDLRPPKQAAPGQ